MSRTSRRITRRQLREKKLREIINSNDGLHTSAEIARLELWAKEFYSTPPVAEVRGVDLEGLPSGGAVELFAYKVKAFERFCEKRGLDPGKSFNEILETFLPLLVKSKEARKVFFRASAVE